MKADAKLKTYRDKRRFDETSEPAGGVATPGARFLVQKHEATRLHYDFRIELDGVLMSWAVTKGPSYQTGIKRLAVRTEDHPLDYAGFEGTIPKGHYGGGTVMLWDQGTWAPNGDPHEGLAAGKLAMILHGERLRGHWALVRLRADRDKAKSKRENWLLIKEKDEYANTREDLLETQIVSVASGRTMAQIAGGAAVKTHAGGNPPAFTAPALASLVDEVPAGDDYSFEVKFDGYRAMIAADGDEVSIYTRSGLDWTARFPAVAQAVAARGFDRVLIDAEIVVLDKNGRSDFAALVGALESGKGALSCFAFDLLMSAGDDLRAAPLRERQAALARLIGMSEPNDALQISEVFKGDGAALLRTACGAGLEGIIAKRMDAPYRAGRGHDWLKIKCGHEEAFVVIGFAASGAARRPFASLLLAQHRDGALRYAGRAGSGFDEATLASLAGWRDAHVADGPAADDVPAALRRGVTWVAPALVVMIKSAGRTGDGMVRHSVFAGRREDKVPKTKPKTEISHPDRVLYKTLGITKGDVATYIAAAAPFMMPFIGDRFVSFLRAPQGAGGKSFFQRHPGAGFGAAWSAAEITTHDGKQQTYMYCDQADALARAVQMGVLEFHIWGSAVATLEQPDRIVFDLDPDEGLDFETVKQGAQHVRAVLDALGLDSVPLLSGGKGIHVVVPVTPGHEWPAVKAFAANVAARIAEDKPDLYVATMSKAKRTGRIFIDHFRNERGATAIAPFSPRARERAAVAWPVTWEALAGIRSADCMTIPKALAALKSGDVAWGGARLPGQRLSAGAMRAVAGQR